MNEKNQDTGDASMHDSSSSTQCELSVVLAASHEDDIGHSWEQCLTSIARQLNHHTVEVFAVTDNAAEARLISEKFANVTLIESETRQPVQPLWGLALPRARGRVIAITDACCIPDARWIEAILRAHEDDKIAIGGAIEMAPGSSPVDWAVYFARYFVRHMPLTFPFDAGPTLEVPCENGTYKHPALAENMNSIAATGFWEVEVNANLRGQGHTLWCDPRIVVQYTNKFSLRGFARHRWVHGRIFGRMRAAKCTPMQRAFYILTAPAIPIVLLSRVVRNVMRKRRFLGAFALSLPLVIGFLICWSVGEFAELISRHTSPQGTAQSQR